MLFHCLYQHPFSDKKMEERLWNVACDLAVELLIWQNIPENLWQYSSEELENFICTARRERKLESLVWLMRLKDQKYGYKEKKFDL